MKMGSIKNEEHLKRIRNEMEEIKSSTEKQISALRDRSKVWENYIKSEVKKEIENFKIIVKSCSGAKLVEQVKIFCGQFPNNLTRMF